MGDPASITDQSPTADAATITEQSPTADAATITEQSPMADPASITDQSPTADAASITDQPVIGDPATITEQSPMADAATITEQSPMADPAPITEQSPTADAATITEQSLPPEIAEKMTAAGFTPQVATLVKIIENFARAQADARAKAARVAELERSAEEMWPLKRLVPLGESYEIARRAAERGVLGATRVGGRWFCTEAEMERWVAATGRRQRR
jgi:UDP-3-O-[3-hydroxymyristoyl] glucosamine N-acyltransferase